MSYECIILKSVTQLHKIDNDFFFFYLEEIGILYQMSYHYDL